MITANMTVTEILKAMLAHSRLSPKVAQGRPPGKSQQKHS
jgi:hypothetical protein